MREQSVLHVLARGEAVLVRLLRACNNTRYTIMIGNACAALSFLCRANNYPEAIR
jgi:hypothetical protein